jgi:hypothetical protein
MKKIIFCFLSFSSIAYSACDAQMSSCEIYDMIQEEQVKWKYSLDHQVFDHATHLYLQGYVQACNNFLIRINTKQD